MEKLNVAIADDNEKMVEVLSKIIDQDEELKLVGKAHNGEEICNIIKEKQPKVRGVIVIAEGAQDISIRNNILSAVMTLLDVTAEKVEILY